MVQAGGEAAAERAVPVAREMASEGREARGPLQPCRGLGRELLMSAIRPGAVVIDVNDLDAQAAFWSQLLAMDVAAREPDWVDLGRLGEGGPVLSLQRVPERKSTKNRVHLDWLVEDFGAAAGRAVALGASTVSPVHGQDRPWQVFADPEGNEFCLCSPG